MYTMYFQEFFYRLIGLMIIFIAFQKWIISFRNILIFAQRVANSYTLSYKSHICLYLDEH